MLAPIKVTSDQVSSHYAVRRHQISVEQAVRWKCYCVCVCIHFITWSLVREFMTVCTVKIIDKSLKETKRILNRMFKVLKVEWVYKFVYFQTDGSNTLLLIHICLHLGDGCKETTCAFSYNWAINKSPPPGLSLLRAAVSNIRPGAHSGPLAQPGFEKRERGHSFYTLNCVFLSFIAFSTDKDKHF